MSFYMLYQKPPLSKDRFYFAHSDGILADSKLALYGNYPTSLPKYIRSVIQRNANRNADKAILQIPVQ